MPTIIMIKIRIVNKTFVPIIPSPFPGYHIDYKLYTLYVNFSQTPLDFRHCVIYTCAMA